MKRVQKIIFVIAILVASFVIQTHAAAASDEKPGSALCQQFNTLWPLADFPEQDRPKVFSKMTYLFCDVYYSASNRDSCLTGLSACPKPGTEQLGSVPTEKEGEKLSRK